MALGQESLSFGNLLFTSGWTFPFCDGVRPSVCIITAPLTGGSISPDIVKISDLVIQQDDVTRVFVDCHLQDAILDAGMDGQSWHLPILDRRWTWQFSRISGTYNVKQGDETLLREKTPQELASLLLDKMGEQNRDVSALENTVRPNKDWDNANAADELDNLLADLGCTLNIDQDGSRRVWITKINEGADLPPGPALGGGYTISSRPLPSDVVILADRTFFEDYFITEPVGLDTDYTYKPLSELSYLPAGGWGQQDPVDFQDLEPGDADIDADGISPKPGGPKTFTDPITGETRFVIDLAKQSVYRTWRITGIGKPTGDPGHWAGVAANMQNQILFDQPDLTPQSYKDLDIQSERSATIIIDGEKIALPSLAIVDNWNDDIGGNQINAIYRHGHSLDAKRGVFHTSTPLVLWREAEHTADGTATFPARWAPGLLTVLTGYYAGKDGVFIRHEVSAPVPFTELDPFSSPVVFYRRELRRRITKSPAQADNVAQLEVEMNAYLQTVLQRLAIPPSTNVTYQKIIAIDTDGQIRQIIYSGGSRDGASTTVSKGRPFNTFLPTAEGLRLPGPVRELLRRTARK